MWENIKPSKLINSNRAAFWIPGFAVASWGPFIPYVKERFNLSEDHLGMLLMCMAIGAGCALLFASAALTKFGVRSVIQVCSVFVALSLGLITVVPDFYSLCAVLFLFGLTCECISMGANVNAGALEKLLNRNIMSGLHGVYSLGNAAGVFIVATFLSAGLTFIAGNLLLTAAVLSVAVIIYCGLIASRYLLTDLSVANDDVEEHEHSDIAKTARKKVFMTPLLGFLGLICFVMFMVEGSMMDWTGVLLHSYKNVPLHEAGYGFAAFAIMMTVCRLTGDKIVATLGRRRVLTMGAIFATAGICLAVMVPHPMVCLVGFGMVGVGASNIVPQAISYAATVREVPLQRSILIVNAVGYIGGLLGPALIGFVAHRIGLDNTFLLLGTLVLVVALISYLCIRSGSIAQISAANAKAMEQAHKSASTQAQGEQTHAAS